MFMTAELLDWASSWQPPALIVQPPSFRKEPLAANDDGACVGDADDHGHEPLLLRRRSTAAPLPLEGILKQKEGQQTPSTAVRFMSPPPDPAQTLFDGPPCFIGNAHHHVNTSGINSMRLFAQQGTSPARADDLSSQSQSITAPSSPSVNTTLRSQSFVNLTRKSSEVVLGQLSRSSSLSSSSMKTRALAAAAAAVVRHIVEVGACGDPQCLMFYDPEVFMNPLSLTSRLRIASFRKHPGGTSSALNNNNVGSSSAVGITATTNTNAFGAFVTEEGLHGDDAQQNLLLDLEQEDFEPEELDFDLIRVSRRLFSSIAQQSAPLHDYLLEALNTLSSSSSPLLSTPETFVFALVLLERMQHASLLVRASGAVCTHQQHRPLCDEDPAALRGSLFATNAAQSPTANVPQPVESALTADDRVRSFLDNTTQVRLTKESLQSLSTSPVGSRQCSTPSAAAGIVSDTESNVPLSGTMQPKGGNSTYATMCIECIEQPGLALHASNIHLFFAAAVSVAIKMREDFANGPNVLEHIAALLHCPNVRTVCLAERCLCDMLKFDVTITANEYRMMLRQLASHRPGASSPTAGGRDGQTTPVHGTATPVNGEGNDALLSPHGGGVSPGTSSNFMTLFATV
jgi:hypothetical protein